MDILGIAGGARRETQTKAPGRKNILKHLNIQNTKSTQIIQKLIRQKHGNSKQNT